MYQSHFGLASLPFTITPDTGFFHNAGTHQEALNVLLVALRTGEGFIKVTGEVGTGKTLLCRQLLNSLDDDFVTAYIPNPFLNPVALRMALAEELGIVFARNIGQHRLLKLINERLVELNAGGKHVVLLLDEAQAMPDDSLEALRLLTNLETEHDKLMQVVLFGQPELDRRLAHDHLRQLRQRILFSHCLQPLDPVALGDYLRHRLRVAGYRGEALFTPKALRQLHRASRGIPRLVNVLCHKSLLAAYGRGDRRIDHHHVERAVRDTEDAGPAPRARGRLARWLTAALLGLGAAGTAWGFRP
jgi:MSHA biogenesis protein MshM